MKSNRLLVSSDFNTLFVFIGYGTYANFYIFNVSNLQDPFQLLGHITIPNSNGFEVTMRHSPEAQQVFLIMDTSELFVIDVANFSSPEILERFPLDGTAFGLDLDGDRIFVSAASILVLNMTDLSLIEEITLEGPPNILCFRYIQNNFLFGYDTSITSPTKSSMILIDLSESQKLYTRKATHIGKILT